jgi:hypothetical protein
MKLQDALFNWLQMKIVVDARPEDQAAIETRDFFGEILSEDHRMTRFEVINSEGPFISIEYVVDDQTNEMKFPRETVEQLLHDINSNPKYNE